jgi:integrative and conjugative element protein (TIGR02256 family)
MMAEQFHELADFTELADTAALTLRRAQALAVAIGDASDYSLVQLLTRATPDRAKMEILVVDVECDGVPSRNAAGIQYRERLALCVSEDQNALLEVLALRKAFPVLMHQNHGTRDNVASLCLYFEPTKTVLRTWTPQRFLRRIQWWLVQSAKGELHPADQPVEQLFFASKYEIVLPWNLEELRRDGAARLVVARGEARPDQGRTFFLKAAPKNDTMPTGSASPIELTLPPVVQGFVERDPTTLGDLVELLSRRGVNLLSALKEALINGIGSAGVSAGGAESFVVIILHIPMVRETGGEVHRTAHRAFLMLADARQLGISTGALYLHEKRYYTEIEGSFLSRGPATEWKQELVFPMEVLQHQDSAAARKQSSIADKGPRAALVGAGSLGSAILNLWIRSGWGRWTVMDKDHIKPHNLVRHVAFSQHVGELKCDIVSELSGAATEGAATVKAVCGDACDIDVPAIREALRATELIVDASAALEYPRLASSQDDLPRHASVFVTPSGNGAVLMIEDKNRTLRLRTLEAQYYRALIRQTWGEQHLAGNLGTYWSGASCRDISVAMPYSRITTHAGTLAEQIMAGTRSDQAYIRVWERDAGTGAVTFHEVAPFRERGLDFGDLTVFCDEGLEAQLKALRVSALPNETGGILLGYHDFNIGAIVVVDALTAPVDSRASPSSFERGTSGLLKSVQDASTRTAGIVGYIGEWHSHPQGHSANPSRDDLIQLAEISMGMHDDGLPALQLIVGETDIQILQGKVRK